MSEYKISNRKGIRGKFNNNKHQRKFYKNSRYFASNRKDLETKQKNITQKDSIPAKNVFRWKLIRLLDYI